MEDPALDDVDELLGSIELSLKQLATDGGPRRGSRFVDRGASRSLVEHVAAGGSYKLEDATKSVRAGRRPAGGLATTMLSALDGKALAEGTGSAGGYLVPVETAEEVVKLIRARSAVMRLGPRIVPVKKELDVPSLASGATAYYVAENAAIPASEETFALTPLLRPRELAALVPISNRLLRDAAANPDVEQVIRDDLAEVLALRSDLAFLRGTGTSNEPLGIRNTPGLTAAPSLGTNGGTPSFDNLKDMVAALRTANAPFLRPGWAFHPRTINTLEKVKDTTERYLADAGLLTFDATGGGGTLLGFPFVTTTQIPTNITTGSSTDTSEIYFGSDWVEAWIGEEQSLEIDVSGEAAYDSGGGVIVSAWSNRQHVFRCVTTHDFALRRPSLFSLMTGVRP